MGNVLLIRDKKIQGAKKSGYYGTILDFQTLDPGLVIPGVYKCQWMPSPHLTLVVARRQYPKIDPKVLQGLVDDALAGHRLYSWDLGKINDIQVVYAYHVLDAKLVDGTTDAAGILFHGGTDVEDSEGCFLTGLTRAEVFNKALNVMEPGLLNGIDAKNKMHELLGDSFPLEVQNGPGIELSPAA